MHPDLIIFDRDGALADGKPGANTVWLDVVAE